MRIKPETQEFGVGPLNLDVAMARRQGWSDEQLEDVAKLIGNLSRWMAWRTHLAGPVAGCPCETCDAGTPDSELAEPGSLLLRKLWRAEGKQGGQALTLSNCFWTCSCGYVNVHTREVCGRCRARKTATHCACNEPL